MVRSIPVVCCELANEKFLAILIVNQWELTDNAVGYCALANY